MLIIVQPDHPTIFLMPALPLRLLLSILLLCGCGSTSRIDHTTSESYVLGTPGFRDVDSATYRLMLPYKMALDSQMNQVVGVSEQVMEKGMPEGLLGNFVADLALEQSRKRYQPSDNRGIDFCFLNNGGLRSPLPKGPITKGKIFELMPFENELIVLTLDGSTFSRLLDFIAAKGGMPVSGIRFRIQNKKAVNVEIGNQPADTTRSYKVVTSDYLANGGDNLSFLAALSKKESLGLKLRDAILNHISEQQSQHRTLRVTADNRISNEQ